MKTSKATPKSKRGAKGLGRLYIRDARRKEFKAGTPNVKGGVYWLEYWRPIIKDGEPSRKKVRAPLKDSSGKTCTALKEAEKARNIILREFVTASTEQRTAKLLAELEQAKQEHAQAVDEANPPLSIAGAWEEYKSSSERPDSGLDTMEAYKSHWTRFATWLEKKEPETKHLRNVTRQTTKAYAGNLVRAKVSPNTFNKHINFLKLIFNVLADEARTTENPFEKIKTKKLKPHTRRELSAKEMQTILNEATGDLKTLFLIGAQTGMRLGDCCTLKWNEVDLERGLIRHVSRKRNKPLIVGIPAELHRRLSATPPAKRNGYILPDYAERYTYRNENEATTRRGSINKEIQRHLSEVCGIETHAQGTGKTDEYKAALEAWEQGEKKDPKPTYKRAVVEVGFHSLRHSWISMQAELGTPLSVVQSIVGHGSPAMTHHYTHTGEEAVLKAAKLLDVGIQDAEFEVLPDPIPDWALELIEKQTAKNWKQIKKQLLEVK